MKSIRLLLLGTLTAVGIGIITEGEFLHLVTCVLLGAYLLVPAFVITVLIWIFTRDREKRITILRILKIEILAGLLLLLSLISGQATLRFHEGRLRAYVTQAVPVLDDYRKKHGKYPETLNQAGLPLPPNAPKSSYSADGDRFQFQYDEANGFGMYFFESNHRVWIRD